MLATRGQTLKAGCVGGSDTAATVRRRRTQNRKGGRPVPRKPKADSRPCITVLQGNWFTGDLVFAFLTQRDNFVVLPLGPQEPLDGLGEPVSAGIPAGRRTPASGWGAHTPKVPCEPAAPPKVRLARAGRRGRWLRGAALHSSPLPPSRPGSYSQTARCAVPKPLPGASAAVPDDRSVSFQSQLRVGGWARVGGPNAPQTVRPEVPDACLRTFRESRCLSFLATRFLFRFLSPSWRYLLLCLRILFSRLYELVSEEFDEDACARACAVRYRGWGRHPEDTSLVPRVLCLF